MNTELTDDDVERIKKEFTFNTVEHLHRARRLLKHAKPGNWAFRELENMYGFTGDYQEADHGEPPMNA